MSSVPRGPRPARGSLARRVTLQQRRVLLARIRSDVERIVEDISAMAETLRVVGALGPPATETERTTLRLLQLEQRRQQLELARLTDEFQSLALRGLPPERPDAAA